MLRSLCAIVLVTLGLGGCEKAATPSAPVLTTAPAAALTVPAAPTAPAAPQVLRVVTEGNFPPFNYVDSDGALAGFDVDMAKELCARLKVRCQISAMAWDWFISALQDHKVDMIVASMAPAEARKQYIAFTDPYYRIPQQLVGLEGLELALDESGSVRPDALGNKRLMVLNDTVSESYARKAFPGASIVERELSDNWADALLTGEVDLALEDSFSVEMISKQAAGLQIYGGWIVAPGATTDASVAVQKDNPALVGRLNAALAQIRADGTFAKITARYSLQSAIAP